MEIENENLDRSLALLSLAAGPVFARYFSLATQPRPTAFVSAPNLWTTSREGWLKSISGRASRA
jgi:hypothetical protein